MSPANRMSRRFWYSLTTAAVYSGPSSRAPTAIICASPGGERRPWAMRRQAWVTSRLRVTRQPSRMPQAL